MEKPQKMKYKIVTTFPAKHYESYGKRMIETFRKNWDSDVELHVYHEGIIPQELANVKYIDLLKACPDLVAFKEHWKDEPVANGMPDAQSNGLLRPANIKDRYKDGHCYLWDAVRFSHKVYCQTHAALQGDADVMFWLDADTVTFRPVGKAYENFGKAGPEYLSYLGRTTYTECGFISFDLRNQHNIEFMNRYKAMYDTNDLFTLHQWTDCHAFDHVRTQMEAENKIINHNMNVHGGKGHPFVNCILGEYMDHLKGARKIEGSSRRKDVIDTRGIEYWEKVKK